MDNKILSPKSDFIFKLIFGDKKNTDILADFLRSVLELPEKEYTHISIIDPHLKRRSNDDKLGILDVRIHTATGKAVDIEIQVLPIPQMRERILFYASKMITEQVGKGEPYNLNHVISIIITDYKLITENGNYHNKYHLYDNATKSTFTDILEINTLELPKLPDSPDNTDLWDWLRFLKSDREEEFTMLAEKNPQIKKAVGVLMELSQDEQTRLLYEDREKARRDDQARIEGAFEKGVEKGVEKGTKEALLDTAKTALQMKMNILDIMKLTKLSRDEIEGLAKES